MAHSNEDSFNNENNNLIVTSYNNNNNFYKNGIDYTVNNKKYNFT